MDAAIGFLLTLVFLALFAYVLGLGYKNRVMIQRWLNMPYYAEDDRKLRLKRRIEDSQKELADLEKAETEDHG